jgi:hypothetical protein
MGRFDARYQFKKVEWLNLKTFIELDRVPRIDTTLSARPKRL